MLRVWQIVFASAALVLAGLSWRDATIARWLGNAEEATPRSISGDPRVVLALNQAGDSLGDARSDDQRRQSIARARSVLEKAPLEAVAMRELALASPETDAAGYARKLGLAERISRHDMVSQLLLFTIAVDQGRDRLALSHIDKLLTVSPEAGADIYVPLASLLSSSDARQALSAYHQRAWYGPFLAVAAEKAPERAQFLDLLNQGKVTADQSKMFLPKLLTRSLDEGSFAQGRSAVIKYGGARAAALDDFGLDEAMRSSEFAPLTWRVNVSGGAELMPAGSGAFLVRLPAEVQAVLLERITGLRPGSYTLSQLVGANDAGDNLQLEWMLTCRVPAKILWRQNVPVPSGRVRYQSRIDVPADCPVQLWRLAASLDGQQIDGHFRIGALGLRKIAR